MDLDQMLLASSAPVGVPKPTPVVNKKAVAAPTPPQKPAAVEKRKTDSSAFWGVGLMVYFLLPTTAFAFLAIFFGSGIASSLFKSQEPVAPKAQLENPLVGSLPQVVAPPVALIAPPIHTVVTPTIKTVVVPVSLNPVPARQVTPLKSPAVRTPVPQPKVTAAAIPVKSQHLPAPVVQPTAQVQVAPNSGSATNPVSAPATPLPTVIRGAKEMGIERFNPAGIVIHGHSILIGMKMSADETLVRVDPERRTLLTDKRIIELVD